MVWAEGEEKKLVAGQDRNELVPAEALAIWTIPPSPQELQLALKKVQPRKVYLFAVTDPIEQSEAFLARLAGLLKNTINHRAGKVSWSELAAATAQRVVTVRRGLAWLVSQGKLAIETDDEDTLTVTAGAYSKSQADSASLKAEIQSLMEETGAYRNHFKRADKDALLNSLGE